MTKGFLPPLRTHLEMWEREAAAQWQAVIRSPRVLQRFGEQLTRTLESHQHIKATLSQPVPDRLTQDEATRMFYLLERVKYQVEALTVRIDRLERKITQ